MKQRDFEKISYDQFKKDCINCNFNISENDYEEITLPKRATKKSSGYDFYSSLSFILYPTESIRIPTGIKAYMLDDEELLIFSRSSIALRYKVIIDNTIPKIDSDYYGNKNNEGHIFLAFTNTGAEEWIVNAGDRICQGSFYKYLITDTDCPISEERIGGWGSSGK
jgi:dUTP pyrophosphatase